MNAPTEKSVFWEESLSEACLVFYNNTDSLFRLAYFLTGSEVLAEQCFHAALEQTRRHLRAYGSCSLKIARSCIIQSALYRLQLREEGDRDEEDRTQDKKLSRFLNLNRMERLSFVLRRVEGYASAETALLLGVSNKQLNALLSQGQEKLIPHGDREVPEVYQHSGETCCRSFR